MSRFFDPRHSGLKPYVPGEQPKDRGLIKLNTNESPYPPCPGVLEALNRSEAEALRLYSDPAAVRLNRAIAEYYNLQEEQVITGNGSDEILAFSFLAFCGSKSVAFPAVSYGFYPVFSRLLGVKHRPIPLEADFSVNPEAYLRPGENIVLANPNAPTGLALTLDAIRRILDAHPHDVVLIDEAYVDFGARSAVALIPEYDNLLVVQTFSKSRSLAGGRIGFALGQPNIIADLQTVRNSWNPYNVNRLSQLAGVAAMEDRAYFRQCADRIIRTREETTRRLRALGCTLNDSLTNFVLVRLPGMDGMTAQAKLRERGFLVRWFDVDCIRNYLRVTIGSEADMSAFVSAVDQIITEAKS